MQAVNSVTLDPIISLSSYVYYLSLRSWLSRLLYILALHWRYYSPSSFYPDLLLKTHEQIFTFVPSRAYQGQDETNIYIHIDIRKSPFP